MSNKKVTFEDSLENLEDIVQQLEGGELTLDESMKLFEQGMKLSTLCSKKLDEAEKKITIMIEKNNDEFEEKDFGEVYD